MTGALIILAVTVLNGEMLYLLQRFMPRRKSDAKTDPSDSSDASTDRPEGCCCHHLTC